MTRKDKLRENYEDALFALLMESVMEEEGEQLLQESNRLNADPAFEVPEEVHQRCRRTIKRAFARKNRMSAGKKLYRILSHAATVIVACGLLFTVAYAAIPEVRAKTLNLLIEASDAYTTLILQGKGAGAESNTVLPAPQSGDLVLLGYQFPAVPDGFELNPTFSQSSPHLEKLYYLDSKSEGESFIMYGATVVQEGTPFLVDTEDADLVREMELNGFSGLLIEKDNLTHIVLVDAERSVFCSVMCKGLPSETAMRLASGIRFTGE